jgi:hypothetical protein
MEFNVLHWNINSSPAWCHIIMCKNHSFLLKFLSDYQLNDQIWLCFSSCGVPAVLQNTQKSEDGFPCACKELTVLFTSSTWLLEEVFNGWQTFILEPWLLFLVLEEATLPLHQNNTLRGVVTP